MNMHQERPLHLAARTHSYETVKCLAYLASLREMKGNLMESRCYVWALLAHCCNTQMFYYVLLFTFAPLILFAGGGCSRSRAFYDQWETQVSSRFRCSTAFLQLEQRDPASPFDEELDPSFVEVSHWGAVCCRSICDMTMLSKVPWKTTH